MRFNAKEARKYACDGYSSELESRIYHKIENAAKAEHLGSCKLDMLELKPRGVTMDNFDREFRIEVLPHLEQDGYSAVRREGFYYGNIIYTISW